MLGYRIIYDDEFRQVSKRNLKESTKVPHQSHESILQMRVACVFTAKFVGNCLKFLQ
jgi:hypothetical protein